MGESYRYWLSFYRDAAGKLHCRHNTTEPVSVEEAQTIIELLQEYIQQANPEEIKEQTQSFWWDRVMDHASFHLLDKTYPNDGPGFVFLTKHQGELKITYTRKNPDKKRKELEDKGHVLLHVYESSEAKKLAMWLGSFVDGFNIWEMSDEEWVVQRLIDQWKFPAKVKAIMD